MTSDFDREFAKMNDLLFTIKTKVVHQSAKTQFMVLVFTINREVKLELDFGMDVLGYGMSSADRFVEHAEGIVKKLKTALFAARLDARLSSKGKVCTKNSDLPTKCTCNACRKI